MANRTQNSSCHVDPSASGIYFGSPFGRYPTFHTLTSVVRRKCFQYVKRMFPLFRAIVKIAVFFVIKQSYSFSCNELLTVATKFLNEMGFFQAAAPIPPSPQPPPSTPMTIKKKAISQRIIIRL